MEQYFTWGDVITITHKELKGHFWKVLDENNREHIFHNLYYDQERKIEVPKNTEEKSKINEILLKEISKYAAQKKEFEEHKNDKINGLKMSYKIANDYYEVYLEIYLKHFASNSISFIYGYL